MTELSGRLEGRVHVYPVRVYFENTDAAGIVYHSNYLNFAERARTEMMRLMDFAHARMWEGGRAFAVRHCVVDFRRSAVLDDLLEIRSRLVGVGGATVEIDQSFERPADGLHIARLYLRLASITRDGRPARLPAELRDKIRTFISD
ncbi:MAG: YbgC/FadM family acyl-CoA thioesterase [Rhodospirillales bacterium]|nr:YbgC/FadM family acyl-CoA thioesterase [Rhodospirillales bacterium]